MEKIKWKKNYISGKGVKMSTIVIMEKVNIFKIIGRFTISGGKR